ncbi:MAG: gamma-glutamyl kinase, partial [Octadecabacter sp.]
KSHSTKNMSFDHFANEYAKDDPAHWAQVGDPAKFLRDGKGELLIDNLFQYEQMDLLVSFLEERLDTKIALQQKNVSPKGDMTLSKQTHNKLLRKMPQMFADWDDAQL